MEISALGIEIGIGTCTGLGVDLDLYFGFGFRGLSGGSFLLALGSWAYNGSEKLS